MIRVILFCELEIIEQDLKRINLHVYFSKCTWTKKAWTGTTAQLNTTFILPNSHRINFGICDDEQVTTMRVVVRFTGTPR